MTIEWFTDENTFTPFLARVFALVLPFVHVAPIREYHGLAVPVTGTGCGYGSGSGFPNPCKTRTRGAGTRGFSNSQFATKFEDQTLRVPFSFKFSAVSVSDQLRAAILDSFPRHPPSRRHRFSRDFPHPIIQPSSTHNIYINSNEVTVTTHLHLTKSRHSHVYATALETPHHASQVGGPSPVTNAWLLDFLLQVPNAGCYQKQFSTTMGTLARRPRRQLSDHDRWGDHNDDDGTTMTATATGRHIEGDDDTGPSGDDDEASGQWRRGERGDDGNNVDDSQRVRVTCQIRHQIRHQPASPARTRTRTRAYGFRRKTPSNTHFAKTNKVAVDEVDA
ncbi:hypothetical protein EDB83DRAFT_2327243 [Lactarius deliciosus]|nr:hypothetical protein EDB83DRAFT_2327243 [Lactarius deliciosus]